MISLSLIGLTVISCFQLIPSVNAIYLTTECQEFGPMPGRLVTRNGNSTTVSCSDKSSFWILKCVHGSWVGYVGSCKVLASSTSGSIFNVILISGSLATVAALALACLLLNLHVRDRLNFGCISRNTRNHPTGRNSVPLEELNPQVVNLPPPETSRPFRSEDSTSYNYHPTLQVPQRYTPTYKPKYNDNGIPFKKPSRFHQSHSLSCMYSAPLEIRCPYEALPFHQASKSLRNFQDIYSVIHEF